MLLVRTLCSWDLAFLKALSLLTGLSTYLTLHQQLTRDVNFPDFQSIQHDETVLGGFWE